MKIRFLNLSICILLFGLFVLVVPDTAFPIAAQPQPYAPGVPATAQLNQLQPMSPGVVLIGLKSNVTMSRGAMGVQSIRVKLRLG